MNLGKTLFAQIMNFLPWKRFHRIANITVSVAVATTTQSISPALSSFVRAFAQLSYRESLRDIELCLGAQASKLYHLGLSSPVKRTTLAEANERRDWRIFPEFAQCLIDEARGLYREEPFGIDLAGSVYAFDASTIDLCLSLFSIHFSFHLNVDNPNPAYSRQLVRHSFGSAATFRRTHETSGNIR